MLRRLIVLCVVVALASACSQASKVGKAPPTTTTTIAAPADVPVATVSATAGQKIEGFGASGAWWPNDLIKFPPEVQKLVGRQLFDRNSGIGLTGYRYNIGGGGKGVTNPARAPKEFPDDVAGRKFLRMAADAKVPVLTAFVNSAPPQFTTNGKACGGKLKPGSESAFAAYLTNIVQTLHDTDHVTINYVSPMNEPDDSFPDCGQEGMEVPVAQRAPLVQALATALAKDAPYAKVIADETTADAILASEAPQWLGSGNTAKSLAAIAHHTYDFPNDALRTGVAKLSRRYGVPTWMTEICCYKGSGGVATSMGANYDPTMKQGLWLADQIYDDLTIARDSAWYWWTALSPVIGCDLKADQLCATKSNTKGFNDGLAYYDEHAPNGGVTSLFPSDRMFVLGQFARYVPPGAILHDVSGAPKDVRVMAFQNGTNWSAVAWNISKTSQRIAVAFPKGGRSLQPSGAVSTDESHSLVPAPRPVATAAGTWLTTVPARTVVTYTFTT